MSIKRLTKYLQADELDQNNVSYTHDKDGKSLSSISSRYCVIFAAKVTEWGEWPSELNRFRQVTEVKLCLVRSISGCVTSEA